MKPCTLTNIHRRRAQIACRSFSRDCDVLHRHEPAIHMIHSLLEKLRIYGARGMPEVIAGYLDNQNLRQAMTQGVPLLNITEKILAI